MKTTVRATDMTKGQDMTTQHTPEPWAVWPDLRDPDGSPWLGPPQSDHRLPQSQRAYCDRDHAPRIVACVNACAGIPDPETTIPEMIEALRWIRVVTLKARSQTSTLAHDKARAVLAKLEGCPRCGGAGQHSDEEGRVAICALCDERGQQG